MEYQKNNKFVRSKFKVENWVEINDDPSEIYDSSIQIKFETAMTDSNLCN